MPIIKILDSDTINKIAAGEVIERPAAVVKELVENAIDAKASAVTIEIKDGGISFVRITDNGLGIASDDIELAFERHSTSKISSVEDLMTVKSLGFRGEALSSIASVAQVELITKTHDSLLGTRFCIEGGEGKGIEEIGCPEGTTFIVRNLFFNTPVRRKFLKSAQTEAGYVNAVVEKMAAAHPEISFKFINNGQLKVHTSGNSNLKDIIYTLYGRDITHNLLHIEGSSGNIKIDGYIGKPVISRGNRNYEIYFINGRSIKSPLIARAIEEAYKGYTMQHRYPFVVFQLYIEPGLIDVNVHPTKMEVRFTNPEELYYFIYNTIRDALSGKNLIQQVSIGKEEAEKEPHNTAPKFKAPEPFEMKRIENMVNEVIPPYKTEIKEQVREHTKENIKSDISQTSLFDSEEFVKGNTTVNFRIIGQLFLTYWIIECDNSMYIIDQHAAHEKVLFEKTMKKIKNKIPNSQMISPPIILSLNMNQENILNKYLDIFIQAGYEIEPFGGREYQVSAVPADLPGVADTNLLIEIIDELAENDKASDSEIILNKVASLSCKAAVKGNNRLSFMEATSLIEQLMNLDNPFNCPHGRPTIISMSKYEIEKKFKRIV